MTEQEFKEHFHYHQVQTSTCENCKFGSCDGNGYLAHIDTNHFRVCKNPNLDNTYYGIKVQNHYICDLWEENETVDE